MKWQDYKAEKLQDAEFKKAYDELEEDFQQKNSANKVEIKPRRSKVPPLTFSPSPTALNSR